VFNEKTNGQMLCVKSVFNDEVLLKLWERVIEELRHDGIDVDLLLSSAAENVDFYHCEDWSKLTQKKIQVLLEGLEEADWYLEPNERDF
jgi:hypothetical protein